MAVGVGVVVPGGPAGTGIAVVDGVPNLPDETANTVTTPAAGVPSAGAAEQFAPLFTLENAWLATNRNCPFESMAMATGWRVMQSRSGAVNPKLASVPSFPTEKAAMSPLFLLLSVPEARGFPKSATYAKLLVGSKISGPGWVPVGTLFPVGVSAPLDELNVPLLRLRE